MLGALRLAVPAYAHPLVAPQLWTRLVEAADLLRLVVVNPHDGPGAAPDPAYAPVVSALQDADVRLVGYVDTDYGRRSVADVVADVHVWVRRDGLSGVFLDQVSSGIDDLEHYAQLVAQVRAAGARFVALNPGVHPHPGYVDLANLTVTFEGSWEDYRGLELPPWTRRFPASRLCHLVHGVPEHDLEPALALAAGRHVEAVMVTGGAGSNPWDDVPPTVLRALARRRPAQHAGRAPARPPARPARPRPPRRDDRGGSRDRGVRARRPGGVRLAAAAVGVADAGVLTALSRPLLGGEHGLLGLLVLLLAAAAGAGAAAPLGASLSRRDLRVLGLVYHLCGLAALALAPGPRLALGGLALAGAGAALLGAALLPRAGARRTRVPPVRRPQP